MNMYKLKTASSIAKRFKKTSKKKLLRRKACRSHLLEKKSAKTKLRLRKKTLTNSKDYLNFREKIPYLK